MLIQFRQKVLTTIIHEWHDIADPILSEPFRSAICVLITFNSGFELRETPQAPDLLWDSVGSWSFGVLVMVRVSIPLFSLRNVKPSMKWFVLTRAISFGSSNTYVSGLYFAVKLAEEALFQLTQWFVLLHLACNRTHYQTRCTRLTQLWLVGWLVDSIVALCCIISRTPKRLLRILWLSRKMILPCMPSLGSWST